MTPDDLLLKRKLNKKGHFVSKEKEETKKELLGQACEFIVGDRLHEIKGFDKTKKIPDQPLQEGEQYRFHFDATRCIGCSCCVVACNEQNNNPSDVQWRRVGEIEGGQFPHTQRLYLSMGCNHCLDPACLTGCPVDAYEKDEQTGIVKHDTEACIGCQYCEWNCDYGVPRFDERRNVVSKCDMCYGRLEYGMAPACVDACPEEAIMIEKVNIEEWKKDHEQADAPGMPDSSHTLSTTRITLPENFPHQMSGVDQHRLEPQHPHWSLILMTVLTQLSVGGFFGLWVNDLVLRGLEATSYLKSLLGTASLAVFFAGALALGVSIFHLGRPLYAYRALKMWRRSWLSREVLFFSLFSGLATAYAALWWNELSLNLFTFPAWTKPLLGSLVVFSGTAGVFCSAKIYMVPARPSWNTPKTLIRFFLTALTLGPLFTLAIFASFPLPKTAAMVVEGLNFSVLWLCITAISAGFLQLVLLMSSFLDLVQKKNYELNATAFLLTRRFRWHFSFRLGSVLIGAVGLPLILVLHYFSEGTFFSLSITRLSFAACTLALASELLGRYLFFVTVMPKKMAGGFLKS